MKTRVRSAGVFTACALLVGACGYHADYSQPSRSAKLRVELVAPRTPHADAAAAIATAMRAELAREGASDGASRYVARVEVLRVDESSAGLKAAGGGVLATGSVVSIVARARVELPSGEALDTGDVRRSETYAASDDSGREQLARDAALRSAGRRVGRALARRLLGYPEPADDR